MGFFQVGRYVKTKKTSPLWGGKTNNMIYNKKQNSFRNAWGAKVKTFTIWLIKRIPMKNLIYLIITLVVVCLLINYIAERTVTITLIQLEDDLQTEWVKAAKECESDTITIADSINTELGDAVR